MFCVMPGDCIREKEKVEEGKGEKTGTGEGTVSPFVVCVW